MLLRRYGDRDRDARAKSITNTRMKVLSKARQRASPPRSPATARRSGDRVNCNSPRPSALEQLRERQRLGVNRLIFDGRNSARSSRSRFSRPDVQDLH
jgi:hypothetical protein